MKKKQLLINNYHTHTFRCGHAHGEDEEYVKAAIKYGYKELGFSDHIFYHNLPQPGIRQNESDYDDYVASITFLKNKYKDKLKILIGYESEYQPSFHNFYLNLLIEGKIEYLILGNHCFIDNSGHYIWYNSFCNDKQHLNMYITNTIEGMKSGLFAYVAHPDIILNSYDIEDLYVTNKILELLPECEDAQKIVDEIKEKGSNQK